MKFRTRFGIAASGALAFSLLAPSTLAQRAVPPAGTGVAPSQLKLPAPPPPVQTPITRDTQGRTPHARAPKVRVPEPQQAARGIPRDQLYFATQADGSPMVHGRNYKAEFTPAGATFIPFFGSAAPHNHPLNFRIQGITAGSEQVQFSDATAATRSAETVSYARGGVTEVYALGVDSLEQKFVFDTLPASGELVVRLACTSDMSAGSSAGAILFSGADGSVRYGAATVVDAHGAKAPAQTELDGQQIGIHVSAEFLANAAFPITIDPVITTYNVNWGGTGYDDFAPAVAWDETNQRYCTVIEEVYSATDDDVIYVFSDAAGNFLYAGYINFGGDFWATPDVANNNNANQFYIVASVGDPAGGLRTIRGCTLDASTAVLGTDTEISVGTYGEDVNPSVGGDPFGSTAAYYTVVWERIFSPGSDTDIILQQVDQTGALLGTALYVDNSGGTLDGNPRISKSCQGYGLHSIVWQRMVSPTDGDIYGAQVFWNGTLNIGSTALVTFGSTTRPACSPIDNSTNWLLVYEYDYFTDHDIYGAYMSGVTANDTLDLSDREDSLGTGTLFENQIHPAADTDGNHFAYSYSESYLGSGTDYDIFVSSVDVIGGNLMVGELHQNLAASTTHEDFPRMCSQQAAGGSGNRMGVVWSDDTGIGNLRDVEAAVYATSDFTKICSAFYDGVGGCPCSNNPSAEGLGCNNSSGTGGASINGYGDASLSADTAVLWTYGEKPTAPSMVAQGSTLIAAGAGFGQGLRCAGGSLKRMYLKIASGGSITAPTGIDPSISVRSAALGDPLSPGLVRYYFVYYRDPSVLGGCPLSAGFNSTDTVRVLWRP